MVKLRYVGLSNPVGEFDKLRPYADLLRKMQQQCRPFGKDYHAIAIALEALDSTAYHFTRRPHFFGSHP